MAKSGNCSADSPRTGIVSFYAKTQTGTHAGKVCTVGHRTDIEHFVTVENFSVHDAVVQFHAEILNPPACLHFDPGATTSWTDGVGVLPQGKAYEFRRPLRANRVPGSEFLRVTVTVTWEMTGKTETSTMNFPVSA